MVDLGDICSTIQQVAEAIAAVLKVEVTVVDSGLRRVAGTGSYRHVLGQTVPRGSTFEAALATGKPVVLTEAVRSQHCQNCELVTACHEAAHVCSPILAADGQVLGVMGLVAFDDDQRRILTGDTGSHVQFVTRMCNLIAAKVAEESARLQLVRQAGQLRGIVEAVHEGLLAVDQAGKVISYNAAAEALLRVERSRLLGAGLEDFFPDSPLLEVLKKGTGQLDREILGSANHPHCLASCTPIYDRDRLVGAVAVLRDIRKVRRLVYQMTGEQPLASFAEIIGSSPALQGAVATARRAAPGKSTILISGESGTGKELFARAIHQASGRGRGPFIAVNCAAIPEMLLESELFGYEPGAFTGASRRGKPGKFELADEGTIFLDEVGDLPLHLQGKLLRVLQGGSIERVGGTRSVELDVRVIAATNRDLEAMMARKEFRPDLYYRLSVIPLVVPPLRQRKGDIPVLAQYFVDKYGRSLGKPALELDGAVLRIFLAYTWPGNVRELENAIEYAVNMVNGPRILAEHLPGRFVVPGEGRVPGFDTLEEQERQALVRAIAAVGFHDKSRIARLLGVSRATVYRKLKKYALVAE